MRKYITIFLLLIVSVSLVRCYDYRSIRVSGRVQKVEDNRLLIGSSGDVDGHIWISITEDTILPKNFPKDELLRYSFEFDIVDVNKDSYPIEATAEKITFPSINTSKIISLIKSMGSLPNITGIVVGVHESWITVNQFDDGLIFIGFDEKTSFKRGVLQNSSTDNFDARKDFKIGNIVEIRSDVILESYPGQTTAKKVFSNEKYYIPNEVAEYFNPNDSIVFLGSYDSDRIPLYLREYEECEQTLEIIYTEMALPCISSHHYVVLYNNEVLPLKEAINRKLIDPRRLINIDKFRYSPDYLLFNDEPLLCFDRDDISIEISNLKGQENRYFLKYKDLGVKYANIRIYCDSVEESNMLYELTLIDSEELHELRFSDCNEIIVKSYNSTTNTEELIGTFTVN